MVSSTKLRSGSRYLLSGVGTQMISASASRPGRNRWWPEAAGDGGVHAAPGCARYRTRRGIEFRDLDRVDVEAEHAEADFGEAQHERQADIAETDDADHGGLAVEFIDQLSFIWPR